LVKALLFKQQLCNLCNLLQVAFFWVVRNFLYQVVRNFLYQVALKKTQTKPPVEPEKSGTGALTCSVRLKDR
jgi:hypothetical protein